MILLQYCRKIYFNINQSICLFIVNLLVIPILLDSLFMKRNVICVYTVLVNYLDEISKHPNELLILTYYVRLLYIYIHLIYVVLGKYF